MKTFQDYGIEVNGQKTGKNGHFKVTCPRCSASRSNKTEKCLSVHVDKGIWKCHHCDWAGGLGKEQAYDFSGRPKYGKPKFNFDKETYILPQKPVDWFENRKIPLELVKRHKITATNSKICFPYFKNGNCVNAQTRVVYRLPDGSYEKKFFLETDCELVPYNWDNRDEEETIIVEGQMDALAVEAAGYKNVISVPNGTKSLNFLGEYESDFMKIKKFVIAVDNDGPGQQLEEELSSRLGKDRCTHVIWPDDCKDANDVLIKHTSEVLATVIDNAKSYPIDGVYHFSEFQDQLFQLYDEDLKRGFDQGICYQNENYSVALGELTAITGIPNHGKSTVLNMMLVNLIKKYNSVHGDGIDFKIGIFTPENMPAQNYIARTCAQWTNSPFEKKYLNRMPKHELEAASNFLSEYIFLIQPDMGDLQPARILSLARSLVLTQGVKGIVLDPFNKLENCRYEMKMNETEYVGWFLNMWSNFARQYNVHVWIVVHPRKMERDPKNPKDYLVPGIYDIIGSSNWGNICDNVLCVWRSVATQDEAVYLYSLKIRNFWVGNTGAVSKLKFKKDSKTLIDYPEESDE